MFNENDLVLVQGYSEIFKVGFVTDSMVFVIGEQSPPGTSPSLVVYGNAFWCNPEQLTKVYET